jgi:hypothetical protein
MRILVHVIGGMCLVLSMHTLTVQAAADDLRGAPDAER